MKIEPSEVMDILRQHMLVDGYDLVVDLEHSTGNCLVDARSGSRYLDFFSFFASNPLGFNHPRMLDPVIQKKLAAAATQKPSNSEFYSVELAEFVKAFFDKTLPADVFKYIFLISGGALAVENALKAAFDWKVRRNFAKGHQRELGSKVLHFQQAFHGRSGYTLSITKTADPRKTKYFAKFDWPVALNPKITFPLTEENLERVKRDEETSIAQIKAAIQENPDDIAAIIIEPIQGEGGDNHFRKEFFQRLRHICDESEILLIYDEIQSGAGITGKWWAHEHFGIRPDIMCFGKKTQVCGIVVTSRIEEVENHVFAESSRIKSTWGGNFVDIVRSSQYLDIIAEDGLVENARRQGVYFLQQLNQLAEEVPGIVSNVRGRGLFIAFDLPSEELRDTILKDSFNRHMIILKSGVKSLRFRPSLIVTENEIDQGVEILRESMRAAVN
jgi:L-lysine 6-transaminase